MAKQALAINLKPNYYRTAVAVTAAPGIIEILLLVLMLLGISPGIHIGLLLVPYWVLMLALVPYYIGSCFFVQTNELAGVTVLETPALEIEEGFIYAPLFLTELLRYPRPVQQNQFPAEPEQISSLPDEERERLGEMLMVPMRITTGGPEADDEFQNNILNEQLTLEPQTTVRWQIKRAGFFEFYINTPGDDWLDKKKFILQSMRDTIENALNIEMSRHSAAWSIAYKAQLVQKVLDDMVDKVDDWGITICEVNILNLVPSHDVNIALGKIPEAKAVGQALVIEATNKKTATILEAEGEGRKIVILETAAGEGLKARSAASGVPTEELARLEAAVALGKDNAKIVIGSDILGAVGNLLGGVK